MSKEADAKFITDTMAKVAEEFGLTGDLTFGYEPGGHIRHWNDETVLGMPLFTVTLHHEGFNHGIAWEYHNYETLEECVHRGIYGCKHGFARAIARRKARLAAEGAQS